MKSRSQLPASVQAQLRQLVTQKNTLLEAMGEIQLQKEVYTKAMETYNTKLKTATSEDEKATILSSAQKTHQEFIAKVTKLKSAFSKT